MRNLFFIYRIVPLVIESANGTADQFYYHCRLFWMQRFVFRFILSETISITFLNECNDLNDMFVNPGLILSGTV